jgi:serine/threonine protein kinase
VHLGDILNDRYHIFRKLGVGSQSTVWLAHDSNTSTRRYVALKIFGALTSSSEIALKSILQPVSHPGKAHVEVALDSFMVKGIHGEHFCKVLEPLGVCLRDVLEEAFLVRSGLNEPEGWLGRVLEGDKWSGQTGTC